MLKVFTTVVVGLLLALTSQSVIAVEWDRLVNGTLLDVSLGLKADAAEQITPDCVRAEVAVGDRVLPDRSAYFRLEPGSARPHARASASTAAFPGSTFVPSGRGSAAREVRRVGSGHAPPLRLISRLALARGAGAEAAVPMSAVAFAVLASESEPDTSASAPRKLTHDVQQDVIQSLQQQVEKLHAAAEASSQSSTRLQARLREAEASRSIGWLGYAIGSTGAALLLGFGVLIGRRTSEKRAGAPGWSDKVVSECAAAAPPIEADVAEKPVLVPSAMTSLPEAFEIPDDTATTASTPLDLFELPPTPASALSADDQVDLEQQAEFFVALGQDESAVDLLNASLRGGAGSSASPYLKLLEIHRRREERDAYESIRELHDRRFDSLAPCWADDPTAARGLDDHPEVMRQIESAWRGNPSSVMELIQSLMTTNEQAARPLDLPALADLQFLHQLAQTVLDESGDCPLEASADPRVDLLLPLSHSNEPGSVVAAAIGLIRKPGEGGGSVVMGDSKASNIDLELDFLSPPADPKPPE